MEFETFDQLFKYRPSCLCGKPLILSFRYSSALDDDYSLILPKGYNMSNDGSEMIFNFSLDGRKLPTGKAEFTIAAKVSSPYFNMKSHYTDSTSKNRRISSTEFVKSHFTHSMQKMIRIILQFRCSELSIDCPCSYYLETNPIQFNYSKGFNAANGDIATISLSEEKYSICNGENAYIFHTIYATNKTSIFYHVPKSGFVIGGQEKLEVPAEKFSKFPLDQELLLNKLKTLLLFS